MFHAYFPGNVRIRIASGCTFLRIALQWRSSSLLSLDMECCTDEYITRFLLARKYRTEQAAALIAAYQAQITHRQDIFGNLTARDPALQRALRAAIPGVLPARDRYGCVCVYESIIHNKQASADQEITRHKLVMYSTRYIYSYILCYVINTWYCKCAINTASSCA